MTIVSLDLIEICLIKLICIILSYLDDDPEISDPTHELCVLSTISPAHLVGLTFTLLE